MVAEPIESDDAGRTSSSASDDPLTVLEAAGLLAPARSPRPAPRRTTPLMSQEDTDRAVEEMSDDTCP